MLSAAMSAMSASGRSSTRSGSREREVEVDTSGWGNKGKIANELDDDEFDSLANDPAPSVARNARVAQSLPPRPVMGRGRPIPVNHASLSNLGNLPPPPSASDEMMSNFAKRDAQSRPVVADRSAFPRTSTMQQQSVQQAYGAPRSSMQSTNEVPQWGWPFAPNRGIPKVNRERRCYIVTILTVVFICLALAIGIILGLNKKEATTAARENNPNNIQSTATQPCCSRDGITCAAEFRTLCPDETSCNPKCGGQWLPTPATNCCSTDGTTCGNQFITSPLQCNANQTQCTATCAGLWIAPATTGGTTCCSTDGFNCSPNLVNFQCNTDATLCRNTCNGQFITPQNNQFPTPTPPVFPTPSFNNCCSTDGMTCNTFNAQCDQSQQICLTTCGGQYGPFQRNPFPTPTPPFIGSGCCSFNGGATCGGNTQCDSSQIFCQNTCAGVYIARQDSSTQCCSRDGGQNCDVSLPPFCTQTATNCQQCGGTVISQRTDASRVDTTTARYQQLSQVLGPALLLTNQTKFQDPNTPQARALHWLANLDPLQVQSSDTTNLQARFVLASLYYTTTGQFWINSNGWLGSSTHCNWYGVACVSAATNPNSPGDVITLGLGQNNLVGPIPEELFSGLGQSLVTLDLRENKLNGTIPAATLPSMAALQVLSLYNNALSGAIPSTIGNLPNARRIYLENNLLTNRIPDQIGSLSQLERFDVFNNRLYGSIPSQIGQLGRLQRLWLSNNSFWGNLPIEIGNMVALQELFLDENLFNGALPDTIGNLNALRDFRIYDNNFQGTIPTTLGQLVNLQILYMDSNRFSGGVPQQMGQMFSLREMSLFNNTLNGQIPPSLGSLTNLRVLSLSFNQLTGPIPSTLNQLANLQVMHLYGNRLQGGVPQLTGLTKLSDLFLYNNQLNGPLPTWMSSLPALDDVNLSNNAFQGTIPNTIAAPSMRSLILNGNQQVTGTIPQEVCQLKQNGQLQTLVVDCQVQGCYSSCT